MGQNLWVIFGILALGIFIGGNLGILLMVMLRMAKQADMLMEEMATEIISPDDPEAHR